MEYEINKNNPLLEIQEFAIGQIILKFLLVGWIIFAGYMFSINPMFFGVTIVIAVIFIVLIAYTSIIITESVVEIKHKRILSIFNKSTIINYFEIKSINFEKGKINFLMLWLNLVFVGGKILEDDFIIIEYKNGTIQKFRAVGTSGENNKLIDLVRSRIDL